MSAGELKFKLHEIDRPGGSKFGQTSLVDVDGDGDLDFISGSRGSNVWWFEYRAADDWVRHTIGVGAQTDVGGVAFDVNGDGLIDQVSGSTLYLNTGTNKDRAAKFDRHALNTISTHDNRVADIDGDGTPDLLSMRDSAGVFWYKIPKDPRREWKAHRLGDARHSGLASGDIDGDGDIDVVRADWWFENLDGKGTKWRTHKNIPFAGRNYNRQGMATQNALGDIDGDDDIDIAITDGEVDGAQAGWVENLDGKGRRWKFHPLASGLGALHSVALADFDNDGHLDMFSCEMGIGGQGRWFIWENPGPQKAGGKWTQHIILSGVHGHESRVGDVDGDGDIDICSKPWNGDRHVFLENLLIHKAE